MEEMNVTSGERNELMALQRSRTAAVAQVRRARLILLLDEGQPWSAIKQELRCDSRFISTWGGRFVQARLGGLFARHSGRAPTRDPARLEARVLERTLKHKPRDGSTHWSSRKLAAELKLPFMTVQRIWRKHNVQPHLRKRHRISNDPDFETKAADCDRPVPEPASARGRLLRRREDGDTSARPQGPHAATVCGACREPRLRIQEERHAELVRGIEHCHRPGAGNDGSPTYQRPVRRLPRRRAGQPTRRQNHPRDLRQRQRAQDDPVDDFLATHANVAIHYTPTYSSWLNQVENWFSRIQRDVIARGVFSNVKDLDKKLMRYIRQYNKNPKPIKWKYDNPNKRIRCNSSGSSGTRGTVASERPGRGQEKR